MKPLLGPLATIFFNSFSQSLDRFLYHKIGSKLVDSGFLPTYRALLIFSQFLPNAILLESMPARQRNRLANQFKRNWAWKFFNLLYQRRRRDWIYLFKLSFCHMDDWKVGLLNILVISAGRASRDRTWSSCKHKLDFFFQLWPGILQRHLRLFVKRDPSINLYK